MLPKGNILMIAWERFTRNQALAQGRDPGLPADNNGWNRANGGNYSSVDEVVPPVNHQWYLNNKTTGASDDLIKFDTVAVPASWETFAGDWDGDGDDTVGVYDAANHTFYLNDGVGGDTIGLYDPQFAPDNYTLVPGVGYGPANPVWSYTSSPRSTFFATIISGAQRLPNGNTLINEGTEGRFFEVTAAGDIVWEYVNPVIPGNGGKGRAVDQGTSNAVNRDGAEHETHATRWSQARLAGRLRTFVSQRQG